MNRELIISPGHIAVLWRIVIIISKYDDVRVPDAISVIKNLGAFGGTAPIEGGVEIGLKYDILERRKGIFLLKEYATIELIPFCNDEEVNKDVTRRILKKIVLAENFEWLVFYQEDPDIFKIYIPDNWQQLFNDTGLLEFNDTDVLKWWEEVFQHYRKYKEGQGLQVGNTAEKLSFDFESKRLVNDGHSQIDFYLKWVASVSDRYGYDIGSIRGILLKHAYNIKDSIQIEVKGQQSFDKSTFIFYLTDNEWNVAKANIDTYFFHCWVGVNINNKSGSGPFIVPAKKLINEIQTNVGTTCEWVKCRIVIDLSTFAIVTPTG